VALLSCGSTPAPGNNTARRSAQIILFIYSGEIPEKCPDAVNYQTTAVLFLPHFFFDDRPVGLFLPHSQRGNARCMPLPTAHCHHRYFIQFFYLAPLLLFFTAGVSYGHLGFPTLNCCYPLQYHAMGDAYSAPLSSVN
jgi:hypothetical protein